MKEAGLGPDAVKERREKEAYPVIQGFEKWMDSVANRFTPKSRMGKAIVYTYTLLPRLSRYVLDGRYNIDDNGVENAIRPLALGRLCCVPHNLPEVNISYSCKLLFIYNRSCRWEGVLANLAALREDDLFDTGAVEGEVTHLLAACRQFYYTMYAHPVVEQVCRDTLNLRTDCDGLEGRPCR